MQKIKNILISVYNKKKIKKLANFFKKQKINMFSTGKTNKFLQNSGFNTTKLSKYTKFPEIMDGRIKTLHHKIFASILSRTKKDENILKRLSAVKIDIVIANFYPFLKKSTKKKIPLKKVLNYIDIGGPSIIRSAAKNFLNVIPIVDYHDYKLIIQLLKKKKEISFQKRIYFARKAFLYTAEYENTISNYFFTQYQKTLKKKKTLFPKVINLTFFKKGKLLYGENKHQKSVLYSEISPQKESIVQSNQIHGKPLSYNNICDAEVALECIKNFSKPACVIIKHGSPCGVSTQSTIIQSYLSAYQTDPISAFGGVIAFNRPIDLILSSQINKNAFVNVILAPKIKKEALKYFTNKKNTKILIYKKSKNPKKNILTFKKINSGLLVQEENNIDINRKNWDIVSKKKPSKNEIKDAIFAWKIIKFFKSNAIIYVKNKSTIGIGSGQMSRIEATKTAYKKALKNNLSTKQAVMASDAFLPFEDNLKYAFLSQISCIIQPGGSIRDKKIIKKVNKKKISMIFTKQRHFTH